MKLHEFGFWLVCPIHTEEGELSRTLIYKKITRNEFPEVQGVSTIALQESSINKLTLYRPNLAAIVNPNPSQFSGYDWISGCIKESSSKLDKLKGVLEEHFPHHEVSVIRYHYDSVGQVRLGLRVKNEAE